MIAELPARTVDAFVEVAGAPAESPLLTVELRHLGGALARPHASHGALFLDRRSVPAVRRRDGAGRGARGARARPDPSGESALAPWVALHMYLNFSEAQGDPARFWTEQAYHRLRRIKAAVDPGNVIRSNHPIPAGREAPHRIE
jgi:hypothetical protein